MSSALLRASGCTPDEAHWVSCAGRSFACALHHQTLRQAWVQQRGWGGFWKLIEEGLLFEEAAFCWRAFCKQRAGPDLSDTSFVVNNSLCSRCAVRALCSTTSRAEMVALQNALKGAPASSQPPKFGDAAPVVKMCVISYAELQSTYPSLCNAFDVFRTRLDEHLGLQHSISHGSSSSRSPLCLSHPLCP